MAMRRPRIKAAANIQLNTKRKLKAPYVKSDANKKTIEVENQKVELASSSVEETSESSNNEDIAMNVISFPAEELTVTSTTEEAPPTDVVREERVGPQESNATRIIEADIAETEGQIAVDSSRNAIDQIDLPTEDSTFKADTSDSSSFKHPPKVEYNRSTSQTEIGGVDDVFYSDIEESATQMNLQKSYYGYPMSPSKIQSRQRIRPTPVFGQRRNSFVSTSPSPHSGGNDETPGNELVVSAHKRERHQSASLSLGTNASSASHQSHGPHKYMPSVASIGSGSVGRIRTESGCSVASDTNASQKPRKNDEQFHNHRQHSRRDFEGRFTNGVLDKSVLKMFDLIYYNPTTNPMEQKPNIANIKLERNGANANKTNDDIKPFDEKQEGDVDAKDESKAMPVPQLKLNANGELILDDKSLVIETTAEQEARKVLANTSLIYLDENTGMNGFYKRQKRTTEWQAEETIKFYRCLQTVGTDFSLMCQLFPKRTRRDLKLKFKKEERCNGALINKALLYPKQFNIEELKKQMESEEREREEEIRRWKEFKAKEASELKKANCKGSIAARVLKDGDDVYQSENINNRKLNRRATHALIQYKREKKTKLKELTNNVGKNDGDDESIVSNIADSTQRRRKNFPESNKMNNECSAANELSIKTDTIKAEQHSAGEKTTINADFVDSHQLEDELTELLHFEVPDYSNSTIDSSSQSLVSNNSSASDHNKNVDNYQSEPMEIEETDTRTLVNLDNGVVTFVDDSTQKEPSINSNSTNSESGLVPERELNESDIQQILAELAEGSLVLVSTLDPDNADKVLNELYMIDKNTGELCEQPLDVPESIVQCILSVMN